MFGRVGKVVLFLLIFCLSFQTGFHFWPNFAYIFGARVDYLSPTLYFLDVLLILFIVASVILLPIKKTSFARNKILTLLSAAFILDILVNLLFAKSVPAHLFGMIKVAEFVLFSFFVAKTFVLQDIPYLIDVLALSGIVSSVLGIWQFVNQSSVGGLWYFLGERNFNLATIGISTVNLDHQILRSYAAFPHPNILAFFLLMVVVFATERIFLEKNTSEKVFLAATVIFCSIALILTFSRIVILLAVVFLLIELYTKGKRNVKYFAPILLVLVVSIYLRFQQIFGPEFLFRGIDFREELFAQSLKIFLSAPYFGIGLNNFFIHQAPLIKTISPIVFQPVHNIFILSILSLGLLGWWIFPYVFLLAFRSVYHNLKSKSVEVKSFSRGLLFVLIGIIVVGMFDHFFLTVEQGQIILALTFGLSFSNIFRPKRFKKGKS